MGKTGFIGLRIDPNLEDKLTTIAKSLNKSSSEIIRIALEEFINKQPDQGTMDIHQEKAKARELQNLVQVFRDYFVCNLSWDELRMSDQSGHSLDDLLTYGTVNAEFFDVDLLDEYVAAKKPKTLFREWKSAIERLAARQGSHVRTPWQRKRAMDDRKQRWQWIYDLAANPDRVNKMSDNEKKELLNQLDGIDSSPPEPLAEAKEKILKTMGIDPQTEYEKQDRTVKVYKV